MEIISRHDAHAQGLRHFYTGRACKYGHVSERYTSTGNCIQCTYKTVAPALAAPNVGQPPAPYAFRIGTPLSPELLSFVHGLVLRRVDQYAADFLRIVQQRPPKDGEKPEFHAKALLDIWDAERAAHLAALRAAGWTDALLEQAARYV